MKNNQINNSDYIHQGFISLVFFMTSWKNNRINVAIDWKTKTPLQVDTDWKNRKENTDTKWIQDRQSKKTYADDYVLGSFFTSILTAITDPRDGYRLLINTSPVYEIPMIFKVREDVNTTWKNQR